MKTVLFVPGFQEDLKSRDYASTINAIKSKGYSVKFVQIKWSRTTIDDWEKELNLVYSKCDPKNTILAGFSFGAMTCFVSATKRNPFELWLFSLSPYFAEDLRSKNMKQTWLKNIGHRRVEAFSKLHFSDLSDRINCRTLIFSGRLEMDKWQVLKQRLFSSHAILKNNIQTIVPDTGHDVADPRYVKAIMEII